MTTFIALLRAINLAGRSAVRMADLRNAVEGLGFADVRTVLQSGNVVFEAAGRWRAPAIERALEKAVREQLGIETDILVRSATEWSAIVAANPFPDEATNDPGHLVLIPLRAEPGSAAVKALQAAIRGRERVRTVAREAYAVYPDGIGRSKLTMALIERHIGRGTGRNWNTVLRLHGLASSA